MKSRIMNGPQRIQAALAGQNPDRTPVMLHIFLLAVKEAGMTHREYRENPDMIAKAHIQAVETYGYDGVVIDLDTVTLAGALGVPVDFPDNMAARSHEPALTSLERPCENSRPAGRWKVGRVEVLSFRS